MRLKVVEPKLIIQLRLNQLEEKWKHPHKWLLSASLPQQIQHVQAHGHYHPLNKRASIKLTHCFDLLSNCQTNKKGVYTCLQTAILYYIVIYGHVSWLSKDQGSSTFWAHIYIHIYNNADSTGLKIELFFYLITFIITCTSEILP